MAQGFSGSITAPADLSGARPNRKAQSPCGQKSMLPSSPLSLFSQVQAQKRCSKFGNFAGVALIFFRLCFSRVYVYDGPRGSLGRWSHSPFLPRPHCSVLHGACLLLPLPISLSLSLNHFFSGHNIFEWFEYTTINSVKIFTFAALCTVPAPARPSSVICSSVAVSSRDEPIWDKPLGFYAAVALPCFVAISAALVFTSMPRCAHASPLRPTQRPATHAKYAECQASPPPFRPVCGHATVAPHSFLSFFLSLFQD